MVQMMEKSPPRVAQYERGIDSSYRGDKEHAVRVIIVEVHALIRGALQRIIGNFPFVETSTGLHRVQDVSAALAKEEAAVLILGSSLTVSLCLECVAHVREVQPACGIIVIQQHLYPETTFPIIRSGVQCLLGEDASEKDLARAILAAAAGNTFLDQKAREMLDASFSRVPFHFTEREMQVLPLLRLGISNFCIAQRLGLKEKTVEKHLTHIYEKLHIGSRAEAILRLQTMHI